MKAQMDFKYINPARRNRLGQYQAKRKGDYKIILFSYFAVVGLLIAGFQTVKVYAKPNIVSPIPQENVVKIEMPREIPEVPQVTMIPVKKAEAHGHEKQGPSPTPSELENIVAYIARKFEPEGKDVVVRAINCFYSESGLQSNAVGQNTDEQKSKDHGVAQLNDYWHELSPAEKTEVKANIDRAYEIYKGRGDNFSAWYGRLCN